ATGMLGGLYPPELDRIDVAGLVTAGGGRFVRAEVIGLNPAARTVRLAGHAPLRYDVVSLDLGSDVPLGRVPGAAAHGYPVKPIRTLWRLRQEVEARLRAARQQPVRVVILGGGPSACEVAANLAQLAGQYKSGAEVTLVAGDDRLVASLPAGAAAV